MHHNNFATYIFGNKKATPSSVAQKGARVFVHLPRNLLFFRDQRIADVETQGDGNLKILIENQTPEIISSFVVAIQRKKSVAAALADTCAKKGFIEVPQDYRTAFEAVAAARSKKIPEIRLEKGSHAIHDLMIDFPLRLVGKNSITERYDPRMCSSFHEGHIEVFGKDANNVQLSRFSVTNNLGHGLLIAGGAVVNAKHCDFSGNCGHGVLMDPRLRGDCSHHDCRGWAGCLRAPGKDDYSRLEMVNCYMTSNHGQQVNGGRGLFLAQAGTASITNCLIEGNSNQGVAAQFGAEIDIYGKDTEIKKNEYAGLHANGGIIRIHLPPSHKTSFDNKEGMDRVEVSGGMIINICEQDKYVQIEDALVAADLDGSRFLSGQKILDLCKLCKIPIEHVAKIMVPKQDMHADDKNDMYIPIDRYPGETLVPFFGNYSHMGKMDYLDVLRQLKLQGEQTEVKEDQDEEDGIINMSVKKLKAYITSAGLQFNDCIEKKDLRSRAKEAKILLSKRSLSKKKKSPLFSSSNENQQFSGDEMMMHLFAQLEQKCTTHPTDVLCDICDPDKPTYIYTVIGMMPTSETHFKVIHKVFKLAKKLTKAEVIEYVEETQGNGKKFKVEPQVSCLRPKGQKATPPDE